MTVSPRLSIGMPIYNGENFLTQTMDTLLGQTYTDFELIFCDNASTDGTGALCRAYAEQDARIRYVRLEENIGAAANFNLCFDLARGEYFKWAAHDDLLAPTYLEKCVEVLDREPDVVVAYSRAKAIDAEGNVTKVYPAKRRSASPHARHRFYEFSLDVYPMLAVFGVMRRSALARTRLIGKYNASDVPLLSELSLMGRMVEIPEFLFFYRRHEDQSWAANRTAGTRAQWFDPAHRGNFTFPHWRLLREHIRSIERVSIPLPDRIACYLFMGYWMRRKWRMLAGNLILREKI